jgi:hypothetical protein
LSHAMLPLKAAALQQKWSAFVPVLRQKGVLKHLPHQDSISTEPDLCDALQNQQSFSGPISSCPCWDAAFSSPCAVKSPLLQCWTILFIVHQGAADAHWGCHILKADPIANSLAQSGACFLGDAGSHCHDCYPPWLRACDHPTICRRQKGMPPQF